MHELKIAAAATVAFVLIAVSAPQSSHASSDTVSARQQAAFSEVSAAQKKKKQKVRAQAAPPPGPYTSGWGGWRPADPSFDQYGRPYQPPPGLACPVDLGYGRWGSCNNDY